MLQDLLKPLKIQGIEEEQTFITWNFGIKP